ncbi:uncharacterized protein Dana_GF11311 [Drosophila ananassae]|uniref:Peptidase S1 domain-containing protein n=1 Tax=Drosophila ananassae TaxID=7217 RepID=B3MF19_DROAN|nr:serine protease ami [Drosophila ananassae]EDV37647.2 uncharacterized protein Dana_GF11311 [Drosophila ananassae]
MSEVCNVIIQGQFSSDALDNNLARLQLCEPAPISDNIIEIAVFDKQPKTKKVLVSGWSSFKSGCRESVDLRKAILPIPNLEACAAEREGWFAKKITDLNICTTKRKKLCSFDMGSPLVSFGLVGILSKSDCSDKPEVYTNLENYRSWLDLNTKD